MSQLVHEVRHFVVREGEGVPIPDHHQLAAEAQTLAKGGHIVHMTVPGGNVVMVGPHDDPAQITESFEKALPKPKPEHDAKADSAAAKADAAAAKAAAEADAAAAQAEDEAMQAQETADREAAEDLGKSHRGKGRN
jgi:hypothetical protein